MGVAVSGSTDAARAAADIVLTEPGLVTIVHGILIARCIFARMRNFITYRIAATLQLLLFFFIAIFAFRPVDYEPEDQDDHYWPNFFHMPVRTRCYISYYMPHHVICITLYSTVCCILHLVYHLLSILYII